MKLIKAHLIFTSFIYRLVMTLVVALIVAVSVLLYTLQVGPIGIYTFRFISIVAFSLFIIMSDTSVYGGIHNKEGGKIAVVQSSFYGEKMMLMGLAADRVYMFLWIAAIEIALAGGRYKEADVAGNIFNIMLVYAIAAISVNINRYFYSQYTIQLVSIFEMALMVGAATLFWVLHPVNNWILAIVLTIVSIALAIFTVYHGRIHMRRAYND